MSSLLNRIGQTLGIVEDDPETVEPCATESDAPRPDLTRLVRAGWAIKQRQDEDAQSLMDINNVLKTLIQPGDYVVIDSIKVSHQERTSLDITDPTRLAAALGSRFEDLVKTDVKFKMTDKLEDLAFSGDGGVVNEEIRSCIVARTLSSIVYRASKAAV